MNLRKRPNKTKNTIVFSIVLFCINSIFSTNSFANISSTQAQSNNSSQSKNKPYQTVVEQLRQSTKVQAAFKHFEILNEQSEKDLITLTETPAPPYKENKRAKVFAKMLEDAGADSVKIDGLGNVIALRKGTKRGNTIAIAAHLDTVFPENTKIKVKVENHPDGKRFIAPGIGDNTRGLVVVLTILKGMVTADLRADADVLFIGTLGEEGLGDLRGVKYLFRKGAPKIDSFIAIDGGGNSRLIYSGVGSDRFRVSFKGKGGHSWGAFGQANPHHALAKAITLFTEKARDITLSGPKTSYNVGIISGGTSINSIPFESTMEVDMRSRSVDKLAEISKTFKVAMKKALKYENTHKRSGKDLTLLIEPVGKRPVAIGDKNSSLVKSVLAAMASENIQGRLSSSSTDANIPISMGIPAVTLSRGGKNHNAHSPQEWWQNTDGNKAMRVAMLAILTSAKML